MNRPRGTRRTTSVDQDDPHDRPLSKAQIRELERRVKDLNDRTRYIIRSIIGPRFELFYHVESGCFATTLADATAFKRRQDAQAVIRSLGKRQGLTILVVKRRGTKLVRVRSKTGA